VQHKNINSQSTASHSEQLPASRGWLSTKDYVSIPGIILIRDQIFNLLHSINHASIQMQASKTEDGTVYQGLGGLQEEGWHAEHLERPAIHHLAAGWCSRG
jgi:hypothetical protein